MHTVGPESLKTHIRAAGLGSASKAALDTLRVVVLRSRDLCLLVGDSGTSDGLLRLAARVAAGKDDGVINEEKSKGMGVIWEVAEEKDDAWECAGVTVLGVGARWSLAGVVIGREAAGGTSTGLGAADGRLTGGRWLTGVTGALFMC